MKESRGCARRAEWGSNDTTPSKGQATPAMAKDNSEISLFENIFEKPVASEFDSALRTSDGGASLLGVIDRRTKLTETLCDQGGIGIHRVTTHNLVAG